MSESGLIEGEPLSPEEFAERVVDYGFSQGVAKELRHYYARQLLNAVCEPMGDPKTPKEFSRVFRIEEVPEEDVRAVRNLYRRQMWRVEGVDPGDFEFGD